MLPICALQKSHKQGLYDSDVKGSNFETEKHPVLQANQHLRPCEVAPSFANNFFCSASDISTGFSWRSYVIQASWRRYGMTIITSRKKLRRGRGYIHEYNTLKPSEYSSGFDGLNLSVKRRVYTIYIDDETPFFALVNLCLLWLQKMEPTQLTIISPLHQLPSSGVTVTSHTWIQLTGDQFQQLSWDWQEWHATWCLKKWSDLVSRLSSFMICILLFMICVWLSYMLPKSLGSTACCVSWQFILI